MPDDVGAPLSVRPYRDGDFDECLRMFQALFPDLRADELAAEVRDYCGGADKAIFVIDRGNGKLAGFVEAGSRPYAEGCATSPVGYVEGWYVDPDLRRSGWGRRLLRAAEDWARSQGYREMASDALLDNVTSHRAHERSGYQEVERIVQFRKDL